MLVPLSSSCTGFSHQGDVKALQPLYLSSQAEKYTQGTQSHRRTQVEALPIWPFNLYIPIQLLSPVLVSLPVEESDIRIQQQAWWTPASSPGGHYCELMKYTSSPLQGGFHLKLQAGVRFVKAHTWISSTLSEFACWQEVAHTLARAKATEP